MKKSTVVLLQYVITFVSCALLSFIFVLIRGIFTVNDTKEVLHYLVDGYFFAGILCTGVGLMILVTNWGAFEFIAYGFMRLISLFKKDPRDVKYPTFYDYHVARAERDKTSCMFLVLIGALYILASLVVLIFWYQY